MWSEKTLKLMPAVLVLFCLLEIFEMALIVADMNKTEELENNLQNDLQLTRTIINLLYEHLKGMDLEHSQKK
ncbi:hypothetical protein HpDR66_13370 [Helicobacter pylori]